MLLHRELADLEGALSKEGSQTFRMVDLVDDTIGFDFSTWDENLFDGVQSVPIETVAQSGFRSCPDEFAEKNIEMELPSTPVSVSRNRSDRLTEDREPFSEMQTPKAGQSATKLAQIRWQSSSIFVRELIEHHGDIQMGDVLLAVLECGSTDATENPRDVANFYCLYAILSYLVKIGNGRHVTRLGLGINNVADLIQLSLSCLLRCLKISNQALSIGMTGWLEYGTGSPLDELMHRPFVVLRNIAFNFARLNQWEEAGCVLSSLVILCEQRLPVHHPTMLTALLDLAIASRKVGKRDFGERLLARSAERLSTYLSESESRCFAYLGRCRPGVKPVHTICSVEKGRESIIELQSFVSLLQVEIVRDMKTLVDEDNEVILVNHCFIADSLSVLANCIAAAVSTLGSSKDTSVRRADQYWRLAYGHYQRAFDGLVKARGLADPSVSRAAYGIARCLREFGETGKALELLTIVVSFSKSNPDEDDSKRPLHENADTNDEAKDEGIAPVFLARSLFLRSPVISNKALVSKGTSAALCLWLMAILSLDDSPNEEGRERAFSYLHAASVSLQIALNNISDLDDEETKGKCMEFLAVIEEEAMQISEAIMY